MLLRRRMTSSCGSCDPAGVRQEIRSPASPCACPGYLPQSSVLLLRPQSACVPGGLVATGVFMKINSVSDADGLSHDHFLHGSAAEASRTAPSPPQATGRTLSSDHQNSPQGWGLWLRDPLMSSTDASTLVSLDLLPLSETKTERFC